MKKIILIVIITSCFALESFAQNDTKDLTGKKTKAEFVLSIYDSNNITKIRITQLGSRAEHEYTDKWLSKVSIENGLLKVQKNEDEYQCWDLENAIYIEQQKDNIIILLGP